MPERFLDDIEGLKEAVVEHRVRLENGTKVFATYGERLKDVETRITPRPPSILKIAGITLTVIALGATSLWGLANMLRDRPTVEQLDKVFDRHDTGGHDGMRKEIRAVTAEQAVQRVMLEGVQDIQKDQVHKLDTLLERTKNRR
jgi:hypothetical protein